LESGWGAKAPGNNLFGIRADRSWTGPVVDITTHEVVNGVLQLESGQGFRAYATPQDSFVDWAHFLQGQPRYHAALVVKDNLPAFARALQLAGYSTSPTYADELIAMMFSVNKRIPA
jgi:flagellar protein FlgJ